MLFPPMDHMRSIFTMWRRVCVFNFFFSIFEFHVLDLKQRFIILTDFWLGIFFSGIWVSSVALCATHTPGSPVSGPLGRQPIPLFSHPLPISSPSILLHTIVIQSAAFRAGHVGSLQCFSLRVAISFLWWPQGLPGLGHFQKPLLWEVSSPSIVQGGCIIVIMGNGLSIHQLSKALCILYSHCLLIFTF